MPTYFGERIMLWWVRTRIRGMERRLIALKAEEKRRVKALAILKGVEG